MKYWSLAAAGDILWLLGHDSSVYENARVRLAMQHCHAMNTTFCIWAPDQSLRHLLASAVRMCPSGEVLCVLCVTDIRTSLCGKTSMVEKWAI